ncbi:MAG TPA: 2-hydroxyacyl-CoA dehydratase family protein [Desulfomonilia bacterium]
MISDLARPFDEIVRNMDQELQTLASEGKRLIGYFCTYTPVELIHASGFIPVRILGDAGTVEKAYTLTPDFICPYLRKAVEKGLNGSYKCLDGLVQGYTCDAACGVANIWEANMGADPFHILPLPYVDQDESRSFLRSGLEDLAEILKRAGGDFSQERLADSLDIYGRIRTLMSELYEIRYEHRLPLSAEDFLTIVQAGFITAPERYLSMLHDLIDALPETCDPGEGVPILVSGSLIEETKVLRIIEESGGRVVADDLCTGMRNFVPAYGHGSDPMDQLIDRFMNRFPCPSRSSAEYRLPRLLDLMKHSKACAMVFVFQKYCTPHLSDYPFLNDALKDKGIPSIMVELDETGIMEGQLKTRLESFFEMIGW